MQVSGAVVHMVETFSRISGSRTLEGSWRLSAYSYAIISGTLTPEEKSDLDSRYSMNPFFIETLSFTANQQISSIDERTADKFIANWNSTLTNHKNLSDSSLYDIAVQKKDPYTVELKGRKNNETVLFAEYPTHDHSYSSTDKNHPQSHYFGNPKTCPNEYRPDWYTAFLTANVKGL